MDNQPQPDTAADLEMRAARIADPSIGQEFTGYCSLVNLRLFLDLKTKLIVACELKEMIDTFRDADSGRVIPLMIPALLEILLSGEAAFAKDSLDYQFRRVLLEILHRIPFVDVIRPQSGAMYSGMLYLLRHDNEENGVTCCKIIIDLVRSFKSVSEETITEFMEILQDVLRNMKGQVEELLSEDSLPLDPNTLMPSIRSFKALAEMSMVIVTFFQFQRSLITPAIATHLTLNVSVLALESTAQKKARDDFEAQGEFWVGIAPTIKNVHAYTDFIASQIKVLLVIFQFFTSLQYVLGFIVSRLHRPT
jgi:transformation/transcription domain-associated protein